MAYFLYSYQPLNGDGLETMICFEPHRYSSVEDAEKFAQVLKVLRHNEYYVCSEVEVRDRFGLIQECYEIPICNSQ